MEIAFNLAWGLCSVGLIWLWMRYGMSDRRSRGTQMLALAMVVLLLLPVISLSDDLVAAQSLAEADSCLRRSTERGHAHPSLVPVTLALAVFRDAEQWPLTISPEFVRMDADPLPTSSQVAPGYSRPPPQA